MATMITRNTLTKGQIDKIERTLTEIEKRDWKKGFSSEERKAAAELLKEYGILTKWDTVTSRSLVRFLADVRELNEKIPQFSEEKCSMREMDTGNLAVYRVGRVCTATEYGAMLSIGHGNEGFFIKEYEIERMESKRSNGVDLSKIIKALGLDGESKPETKPEPWMHEIAPEFPLYWAPVPKPLFPAEPRNPFDIPHTHSGMGEFEYLNLSNKRISNFKLKNYYE